MTLTILDGGMGQELVRRAGRATPLWSTQALLDAPDLVAQVHDEFFAAGADVATTNTYAILPDRLQAHDMLDRLDALTDAACAIAARARDRAGRGIVAGALGPIGFSYRPDNAPSPEAAADIYAPIARRQARVADVLLLETMSSLAQAEGGLMGAGAAGKPVWLALSVSDADGTKLRSGEALADIAPLLERHAPDRVLLNCSRPEAVEQSVAVLATLRCAFGAYANGFTRIDPRFDRIGATTDLLSKRIELGPEAYAAFTDRWHAMGATTLGGCCEIGPAHIAEIVRRLKPARTRAPAPAGAFG